MGGGVDKDLDIVFLSRISPKKNLIGAIKCFGKIKWDVHFTICGPIEDIEYWNRCLEELEHLPANVRWSYEGDVPSEAVQEKLQQYEIFLFPTKGENYGHVIFEALSVGCIPIISDQTPWHVIAERNAGYVLPLTKDMEGFASALDHLYRMQLAERIEMSERAVEIAKEKVRLSHKETGYKIIFG